MTVTWLTAGISDRELGGEQIGAAGVNSARGLL
jgi:hypothetical protein